MTGGNCAAVFMEWAILLLVVLVVLGASSTAAAGLDLTPLQAGLAEVYQEASSRVPGLQASVASVYDSAVKSVPDLQATITTAVKENVPVLTEALNSAVSTVQPGADLSTVLRGVARNTPNFMGVLRHLPDYRQEYYATLVVRNALYASLRTGKPLIPEEVSLNALTLDLQTFGRLVTQKGKLHGLPDFEEVPLDTSEQKEGEVIVKLRFHELHVVYDRVVLEPRFFKLERHGALNLTLTSSVVTARFALARYYDVLDKVIKQDCACFLVGLRVGGGDIQVQLQVSGLPGGLRLDAGALGSFKRAVSEQLSLSLLQGAHDRLPTTDSWICRDDRLAADVREQEARVRRQVVQPVQLASVGDLGKRLGDSFGEWGTQLKSWSSYKTLAQGAA